MLKRLWGRLRRLFGRPRPTFKTTLRWEIFPYEFVVDWYAPSGVALGLSLEDRQRVSALIQRDSERLREILREIERAKDLA